MVAQCVEMLPGELVITLEDCHIYMADTESDYTKGHMDKVELQLKRTPFEAPKLWLNPDIKDIDSFTMNDIEIRDYKHHPFIKAGLL
jgi:thymidylate synthase